ncbi:hypothetical protein HK098_004559 [Nowakowskiella sp. JEL0407]|nr:hypothetical protein HK098_004559 [Nowakowskiella sp. JEL0407]
MTHSQLPLEELSNILQRFIGDKAGDQIKEIQTQLLSSLRQNPALMLQTLATLLHTHENPAIRKTSSVFLRTFAMQVPETEEISNKLYWNLIDDNARTYCQQQLLGSLKDEPESSVRKSLNETIAYLTAQLMQNGGRWDELLYALFECTKSPSSPHKESAFKIIGSLPDILGGHDPQAIKPVFMGGLNDAVVSVRVSALEALVAYYSDLEQSNVRQIFTDAISLGLEGIPSLINPQYEELLRDALACFIELADKTPQIFKHILAKTLDVIIAIMTCADLEHDTQELALEVLLTVAESKPAIVRKYPRFVQALLPVLFQWMTEIEDEEEWYTTEDPETEDPNEKFDAATTAIDRLALSLGGAVLLREAFQLIPKYFGSEQWQARHAALFAISVLGEGCHDVIEQELDQVTRLVVGYLKDPHPRVRYAACNAIGQMSTDFAPKIEKDFHELIMSNLIPVMDDMAFPRVQAHAAAAVINFAEEAEKETMKPYLDTLFARLVKLLQGKKYVQQQTITTIAAVVDSAKDTSTKYYDSIMPILIEILVNATSPEFALLRGKTIECASSLALAVGKEKFMPHAADIIELFRQTQVAIGEDTSNPQSTYLLASWARICQVMKKDFVPYLNIVVPALVRSAELKAEATLLDDVEDLVEENWDSFYLEGQRVGIPTAILEEKSTAIHMLVIYSRELAEDFAPYAERVLEICIPLLNFVFSDSVKTAAALCIAPLFTSLIKSHTAIDKIGTYWHKVAHKILDTLAKGMEYEDEIDSDVQLFSTFYECLDVLGEGCLNEELMNMFVQAVNKSLAVYFENIEKRNKLRKDADHDAEDEEDLKRDEENDSFILDEVFRAVARVFKIQKTSFLPHFDKILTGINNVLTAKAQDASYQTAAQHVIVNVFCAVVQYLGPQSWNYHQLFLERMVTGMSHENVDIRHCSALGIGLCAKYGGENYFPVCAAALPNLFNLVSATPQPVPPELILSVENAISSIAKVYQYVLVGSKPPQNTGIDPNDVLARWIDVYTAMPIVDDQEEAKYVVDFLGELLEANNPIVLGQNNSNLPRLIKAYAEVIGSEALEGCEREEAKAIQTFKIMAGLVPADVPQSVFASLTPEKQAILQKKVQ